MEESTGSSIRVGIIGTGRHGTRYANHIVHDIEGLELAAISRRSADGRMQALCWQCAWYREWPQLVGDHQVEAVIAVVPPALNLEIARACAALGKPLLIEKPLAVSGAAAAEIVDLFARRDLGLTVGQTLRYNTIILGLRQRLPSLGRLFSFSANQHLEPSTLAWHSDPEQAGAGVSFHTAVHMFDALRFMTGLEVSRVMAACRRHNNPLEDVLAVLVEMDGGVVGTIECSKVGPARSGRFEFVGQEGQLHGEQVYNRLEQIRETQVIVLDPGEPVSTIIPFLKGWRAFLVGEAENPVSGEEGLAAVRICEACLKSSRTGCWTAV